MLPLKITTRLLKLTNPNQKLLSPLLNLLLDPSTTLVMQPTITHMDLLLHIHLLWDTVKAMPRLAEITNFIQCFIKIFNHPSFYVL
jgi:hypothetical protein